MYDKRIKIFVILITLLLLVCLLRLTQMQLLSDSFYRDRIAELKLRRGRSRHLKTIRGKILDRKGKVLAADGPQFQLCINYKLSSFLDERVRKAKLLRAAGQNNANLALADVREELENKLEDLRQIIDRCAQFRAVKPAEIRNEIQKINDFIWNQRTFQAWRSNFPDSAVLENYNDIMSVPLSQAMADFKKNEPDPAKRLQLVSKVDIAEMHRSWPLLELKTNDDIFTAQLEFLDISDVEILPKVQRFYPFGPVAAQTIGWVGSATQPKDKELFENEKLLNYLEDDVCGREDGVEYVCEAVLRGRRGEVIYDIDRRLVSRTPTQFGKDVSLTLDIELQQRIENYLADCALNPNCKAPTAAVVVDVATGNILALVSMPLFDLNRARYDYAAFAHDPNEPLRNRAINKQYPPGSVVKPLILIAGLESGKINPSKVIGCPAQKAPKGWPSCWLYNRYGIGHDDKWENNARNAIKGSCNIYFSRLADRIEPLVLQQWLFEFGYGHRIPLVPKFRASNNEQQSTSTRRQASSIEHRASSIEHRELRQAQGQISTGIPKGTISHFEQVPPLNSNERRLFGIGQGNLRVTPLQVANAFAAIARGGLYKLPRLFTDDPNNKSKIENRKSVMETVTLNISPQTLALIYDGMSAVVNEPDGTAYKEFAHSGLAEQGVTVYGKTGSTEEPDNAWFAGFAEDSTGRSISIAVVVEGGQRGSSDAAPLARDIIQFCIDAGYISGVQ